MSKLRLEWRFGDCGLVHEGKERFRYIACGVKLGWAGCESGHFVVCYFFAVAVIIRDGVEFFGMILEDMTVVEAVAKFLPDGGANGMIAGLFVQLVASTNG